ncbi:MAG TPA: DUF4253 domain-containing protein [bacterium]|nr:DUF4253 domain-containing protein [bacterium]
MIDSIKALSGLLQGTLLSKRQMAELPILQTSEKALAVQIFPGELQAAWQVLRSLVDVTGRWPVAVRPTPSGNSWAECLFEEDFFKRFFYEEAENTADISPQGVLAASMRVDVPAFLARLGREFDEANPDAAAHAADREEDERVDYQQWTDDALAIVLLPSPHPWDALAYLHYFGASPRGSEYYIAVGRSWQERYGAELVAHYGTMLQCIASRCPSTQGEAMQLAREHDLFAPDTLARPGVSLYNHARYLLGHDRWFLHCRP